MQDLNRVQLIGHLGHDPEVKYTATGTARTTFSVVTSGRSRDANCQGPTPGSGVREIDPGPHTGRAAVPKETRPLCSGRLHLAPQSARVVLTIWSSRLGWTLRFWPFEWTKESSMYPDLFTFLQQRYGEAFTGRLRPQVSPADTWDDQQARSDRRSDSIATIVVRLGAMRQRLALVLFPSKGV